REPELLEDLFLLAEGVRVHHRLAASYPGLAGETRALGARLLQSWGREPAPSRTLVLDALLLLALGARPRPASLAADAARRATPSLPTSFAGSSRRARRSGREAARARAAGSRSRRSSERFPPPSSRLSGRPSATPSRRRAGRPPPPRKTTPSTTTSGTT